MSWGYGFPIAYLRKFPLTHPNQGSGLLRPLGGRTEITGRIKLQKKERERERRHMSWEGLL